MADEGQPRPSGPARRRNQGGPTVADVAREAGVSAMTVSRVVNREARVLDATRARVEAAIARLGYRPNRAARTLASGRQCRIALLHSNPSAAYLSEILMGSLARASALDVQLLVEQCEGGIRADELVTRLRSHAADAVMLPPPLCDDAALLGALAEAGLRSVQIATGAPSPRFDAITIDDAAAAHAMTSRLIGRGHRRIGFIVGDARQTSSALRRQGYEQALREVGLPLDAELIRQGDFTYRSGLAAAEELLALANRPGAIFASNDDMAAAAVAVAHRLDLEVPRDLAVCGFDDSAMATTIWPELTTVRQPIAEMADAAMTLLVEALRTPASGTFPPQHLRLDFALIERASG